MMPYFLESTVPQISYLRGDKITNHPVNLNICQSIRKSRLHWYPDNIGKASIVFVGCDTEWAFNSDIDRDAEYNRIVTLKL